MPDLITRSQFTDRTGYSLSSAQETQVDALIADASALVIEIAGAPTVTDSWDVDESGNDTPATIIPVVVNMVRRAFDNPHGYTSEQMSDYLYQGGKTSGIFATAEERRFISRAASRSGYMQLDSFLAAPAAPHDTTAWLDGAL